MNKDDDDQQSSLHSMSQIHCVTKDASPSERAVWLARLIARNVAEATEKGLLMERGDRWIMMTLACWKANDELLMY